MEKTIEMKGVDLGSFFGPADTNLKILENKAFRDIFISILEEENDFTAIRKFIQTEPSVTKSKYVTKFLNKFDGLNGQF